MRLLVVTALVAGSLSVPALLTAQSTAAVAPVHDVVVTGLSGTTVSTWPAYDPGVDRFAVTPSASGSGLAVQASSSDAAAAIRVNGRPVGNGVRLDLPALTPGEEVNVQITDTSGTSNQSWIYLPAGFPPISTTSAGAGPEPGHTAVTLRAGPGADSYATLVDARGVPAKVITTELGSSDLNRQPNGHYSLAVALAEDLWGDHVIREYDESFQLVATHRMLDQPKTDFHDSILLPGGGRILMAYIKADDGQTDSWLQEVSPSGEVLLPWNSRDHVDRATDPIINALGDYAHLNSMQVMHDGNLLLSFRHLNQVMKINRTTGEVIWRLGGRRSDFTFDDDPLAGPCAQHTARELANGDIQIFDNGSGQTSLQNEPLCPNPDGAGPYDPDVQVFRPHSRVTVYRLDEAAGEASLVQSHEVGAFSQFAGSAQRLGGGSLTDNILVGTNNASLVPGGGDAPDATELDADGNVVWSLTSPGYATYRAARVDAPDRIAPHVAIASPADGAIVQQGADLAASFGCSDTGGSNLDTCQGSAPNGASLTKDVGTHRLVVTGTDRAGNTTSRSVSYTVTPGPATPPGTQPPPPAVAVADAMIRKPGGAWMGRDRYETRRDQTVTLRQRAGSSTSVRVRIRNAGDDSGRMRVVGSTGSRWITGRWYAGKREVTRQVRSGTWRTPSLSPGESVTLRLVVTSRPGATERTATLRLGARARHTSSDVVRAEVRTRSLTH
ncbi:aryl-sulfate sulfotransferase [Nocardioides sp.]|uniref:aryl-sulfate sulfotransferase n=1 Tax=Nocardioides sp. TaxID=35761 RepID=UPI0035B46FEC